jgi:putative MATE family efflux protein
MSQRLFSNRDLTRLFLPLVAEQALEYLVGITATLFISSVGEAAVSGVSLVDAVIMLLIAAFGALATGGAVVAGQYLGNREPDKANEAVRHLVWLAAAISVAVTVLLYMAAPWILGGLFGSITPEVRGHAATYLTLVNASIPAIALYAAGAAVFRTIGKTKVTMYVAILMNVTNIAASALFIYGFHWDTAGVGWASLGSRVLAAVVMLALAMNKTLPVFLALTGRFLDQFRGPMVSSILKIGVPFAVENGLFQLGRIVVLSLIATFGTAAIAANAVGTAVSVFQVLPGMAVGLGLTTVISRCVGAGDFDQARYYHRKIVGFVYGSQLVLSLAILAFLPTLLTAYHLSAEASNLTFWIIVIHTIGANTFWPLGYTFPTTLRAAGDARFPLMVSLLTMTVCRFVLAWILGVGLGWGVLGAWIAMTADWVARSAFFVPRYLSGAWKKFRVVA